MKIQLDTQAMNALFPEGSDARVELQKAVIANFVRKNGDVYLSDIIKAEIREVAYEAISTTQANALQKAAKDAISEYFKTNWGTSLILLSTARDKLYSEARDAAKKQLDMAIENAVHDEYQSSVEGIINSIKEYIPVYVHKLESGNFKLSVQKEVEKLLKTT